MKYEINQWVYVKWFNGYCKIIAYIKTGTHDDQTNKYAVKPMKDKIISEIWLTDNIYEFITKDNKLMNVLFDEI